MYFQRYVADNCNYSVHIRKKLALGNLQINTGKLLCGLRHFAILFNPLLHSVA